VVSRVPAGSRPNSSIERSEQWIAVDQRVSLSSPAADVGDDQMAGVMSRRLSRELTSSAGRRDRAARLRERADPVRESEDCVAGAALRLAPEFRHADERATLGLSLAVTGSKP